MDLQGKAFYNLLRMNQTAWHDQDSLWRVMDYRQRSLKELLSLLQHEEIELTPEGYLLYAEKCNSPEEVTEMLVGDLEFSEKTEKVYLVVFELWRRLCQDKQTLSIFCDELDYQIELYEKGEGDEEKLQEMLDEFENILDENVDEGGDPQEVFKVISRFLATDIESFIYFFAAAQLDKGNEVYASELLDGFYEYFEETSWLDFLRVRLVAIVDIHEGTLMLQRLLEKLQENPDLDLLFEVLRYLISQEEMPLFYSVFEQAITLLEKEEDFQDLLALLMDYFDFLEKEKEETRLQVIVDRRQGINHDREIAEHDADVQEVKKLMKNFAISQRPQEDYL